MKRAASVFFVAIFLSAFAPASFAGDALRIASAGYGDLFWVMGKRLGEILGSDDVPAQDIATSGDEENIELLVSGKADVAFVSGEAIDRFISSGGSVESLRTIARVWPSAVHVLLRGDFVKTNTIADIDKKYIYIGEKGSVHRAVIEKILAAKGIKVKHLMRDINDATLLSIMRNFVERELDGAIIIGPALNQATDDIISKTGGTFQLIPLSEGDLAAIAGEKITAVILTIPENTYSYQTDSLKTVALPNYLVCRKDLSAKDAALLSDIFENHIDFFTGPGLPETLLMAVDQTTPPAIPFHEVGVGR